MPTIIMPAKVAVAVTMLLSLFAVTGCVSSPSESVSTYYTESVTYDFW